MTPASHDDVRAAAALVACAARRWRRKRAATRPLQAVLLGADPAGDRAASVAVILAAWCAELLRQEGADPRQFALDVIDGSIADEAEAEP